MNLHPLLAVTIKWLGQACFLITTAHGTSVLVDPPNPSVGYPIAAHSIACSAVFVSHEHPDHNWTDAAAGTPTIIAQRGPDTITVFDIDGVRIAHMGDIGELQLTPAQIKSMGHVDVLMMPAGGFFTVSPQEAVNLVPQIKPKIIIPMHYLTPASGAFLRDKLHPVTEFEDAIKPYAKIENVTTRTFTIDPKHLPKTETVEVLKYE
jgi:L-ascorbate metabolism protein UlaG (beta-lactamase superfamily)